MKAPVEYKRWLAWLRREGIKFPDSPRMENLLINSKRNYRRHLVRIEYE